MKYDKVWISSIKHLEEFKKITDVGFRKWFGGYKVPKDFPYSVSEGTPPLVFFSKGKLEIRDYMLEYKSDKWNFLFRNLKKTNFQLSINDIISIERYKVDAPIKYFSINWIRIKTKNKILGGDFLICRGTYGIFMRKVRKRTDKMYEELINLK
jgi:hypothetical protein